MSNRDFQVLTEVYRLLGQFDSEDIAAASRRRTISDNMRIALEALAREAKGSDAQSSGARNPQPAHTDTASRPARKSSRSNSIDLSPDLPTAVYRKNLLRFLLDTGRFRDKASLAEFARKLGITQAANPKFSRERVAHHIAKHAVSNSDFRQELFAAVSKSGSGSDDQTKGWMDLILGSRT